jgi:capsid protein
MGITAGVIHDYRTYGVGKGYSPVPMGGDSAWQQKEKDAFLEWAKRPTGDGMNTLALEAGVISDTFKRDGEVFPVFTFRKDGTPCIQTLETQCFGRNTLAPNGRDGWDEGIRYNEYGEAVEYMTSWGESVPASAVLHVKRFTRAGQRRAWPAASFAINNLFDVKDFNQLAKKGFKAQLVMAIIAKRLGPKKNPLFGQAQAPDLTAETDKRTEEALGAVVVDAGEGDTFDMNRPQFPGEFFAPTIEGFYRDFAVGDGLPFAFIWCSEVGGTTQRFVMEKAWRCFEQHQSVIEDFYNRAWIHFVSWRIATGQTEAVDNWWKCGWRKGRKLTVDLGRDFNQDKGEIENGMQSFEEFYAAYDQDLETEWKKQADALGMTVDEFRQAMREKIFPNLKKPT